MGSIRYGQEVAQRLVDRKHLVHPAEESTPGPGGISMSAASAVSEGAAPYFAPGIALPYDGFKSQQAPQ
eukprot:1008073-Karenia_brevis.AAC.1